MNSKKTLTNEQFFNYAAGFYDSMVDFENGLVRKKKFLADFVLPGMQYAADFGCGTGMDSIALAAIGLDVSAFDVSYEMLKQAKVNASHFNTKIEFNKFSLPKIPVKFHSKFDFITSLGNAFANLNENDLSAAIDKAYELLKPGGLLLVQVLNYDLVLKTKERIIKISSDNEYQIIRSYDFHDGRLDFNILQYNINNPAGYNMITTQIYPHTKGKFESLLRNSGFKTIKLFGGLDKSFFRKTLSKDLVILAAK